MGKPHRVHALIVEARRERYNFYQLHEFVCLKKMVMQ